MAAPKAHSWIYDMAPYVPGKSKVDGVESPVKLASNESVFGPSPKAVEAFTCTADHLLRYPDGGSNILREALADIHGLPASNIICGTGSGEILSYLIHAFAGHGDEIIYSEYGFSLYPVQTKAAGAKSVVVPNKADWSVNVDGILAAVTDKTKLVLIDNPNNPTGTYLNEAEVERLLAGLPDDVLLVLDGAYAECCTADDFTAGEKLVENHENVIMTRTFSKMYALAGLRVGWAYGPDAIIDVLNRVRMPFNVSVPAQCVAIEAVKDQAHLKASIEFNAKWRAWLTSELRATGLSVVESQANFVLVKFPVGNKCAEACNAFLMKNGYIVRHLGDMPDCLRISIGTEEQTRKVFALIKEFMGS